MELERRAAHLEELPTAQLTSIYSNAQREKPPWKKATDFCFFLPEDERDRIDSHLCDTFFSLTRDEFLPSWAIHLFPVKEMQRWKADRPVLRPRLWLRPGLALVVPRIESSVLLIGALCYDSAIEIPPGMTSLWDIDSGEEHLIPVPDEPLPEFDIEVAWELARVF